MNLIQSSPVANCNLEFKKTNTCLATLIPLVPVTFRICRDPVYIIIVRLFYVTVALKITGLPNWIELVRKSPTITVSCKESNGYNPFSFYIHKLFGWCDIYTIVTSTLQVISQRTVTVTQSDADRLINLHNLL